MMATGKVVALNGGQWGDEGKGRFVDEFGKPVKFFVRVAGGDNAGHTVIVDGKKMVAHLMPSGITYPEARCFLGHDMVINPRSFQKEFAGLQELGFLKCQQLGVSPLAHLIMPYCLDLEKFREQARGKSAIGTTLRGIGTTYEMKARRLGIRVGDLQHLEKLPDYISTILAEINPDLNRWGGEVYSFQAIMEFLEEARQIMAPYIIGEPLSKIIIQAKKFGDNVLIEGAQGAELDLTHGTYPYVTSSSTIAGGACSGAGIGPRVIDSVYAVLKAYTTRVGGGPFPTELPTELAALIRERGGEVGASTGRPRRIGWLDGPQLRHASRIGGWDGIVITKADVLQGIEVKVCDYYSYGNKTVWDMDEVDSRELGNVQPSLQDVGIFTEDISGCRDYDSLPKTAKMLFSTIADLAGAPILAISVGPERGQTISLQNPWNY